MEDDFLGTQAMFESAFTPVEGGYLFYPWRWSGGYKITPDEFEALKQNSRQMSSRKTVWTLVGLMIAVITVAVIVDAQTGSTWADSPYLSFGAAGAACAYLFWKGYAPQRLVRGREPIAPPLSHRELIGQRARILSPSFLWLLLLLSLSMTGFGVWKISTDPWLGVPMVIVFGLLCIQNVLTLRQQPKTDA